MAFAGKKMSSDFMRAGIMSVCVIVVVVLAWFRIEMEASFEDRQLQRLYATQKYDTKQLRARLSEHAKSIEATLEGQREYVKELKEKFRVLSSNLTLAFKSEKEADEVLQELKKKVTDLQVVLQERQKALGACLAPGEPTVDKGASNHPPTDPTVQVDIFSDG